MIGANAVIGWADRSDDTNTRVAEYYLQNKLPWEIMPIEDVDQESMEVEQMEVVQAGRQNAISFVRPLVPKSGKAPILPGSTTILFAVGTTPSPNDDYFAYHRFRDAGKVNFVPVCECNNNEDGSR